MIRNILGHDLIKEKLRHFLKKVPKLIIFSGPKGVGKKFTALNFIDELYGGTLNLSDHPDIKIYSPEEKIFKLGYVYDIQKEISLTPFELDKKFFILTDVDKMNKEAAYASLKMFEDIPKGVHFFLTCENSENVLPTILSRASVLHFSGVKEIESHYPSISPIESKIANGCIGKINYIKENNLESRYHEILKVFSNFQSLGFTEVLDFYAQVKDIEASTLIDLFILCSQDLADSKQKNIFLKEMLDFKPKLKLNLNIDTHFKVCLLNIKNNGDSW